MKFKAVHIGWSRGTNLIPSKLIQLFDDSYFNHVFYLFDLCNGMRLVYESHITGGVQITPYDHVLRAQNDGKIEDIYLVTLDIMDCRIDSLWNACVNLHGKGYDKGQIVRYYLSKRWHKDLSRKRDDGRYTCNELVVEAGKEIIPRLYHTDFSYTPEKLFRVFSDGVSSRLMLTHP